MCRDFYRDCRDESTFLRISYTNPASLHKTKHGGLDSRDQSRLRSRTSFVSRQTFLNRRDCPSCQDQLFFSRSKFLKSRLFSRDFDASRFLSRLQDPSRLSRFVKTRRDYRELSRRSQDLSRNLDIVEAFWVWKWWKVSTDWEISKRKYKNPRTSRSRSRQTVEKWWNFQISTNSSISIETFWSGHWCRDEIEKSQSRPRFLDCRDTLFDAVKIFSTVETHSLTTSRQMETPMLKNLFISFREIEREPLCNVAKLNRISGLP